MAGDVDIPSQGRQLMELHRENERLRSALERVESHGSGYAVTIARGALDASRVGSPAPDPSEPNVQLDGGAS